MTNPAPLLVLDPNGLQAGRVVSVLVDALGAAGR